jgi:hypothetical protein
LAHGNRRCLESYIIRLSIFSVLKSAHYFCHFPVSGDILFCITIRPDSPPIPPIILGLAALAAHFAVSLIDLFAQRKTGYRTPLNYGERDET